MELRQYKILLSAAFVVAAVSFVLPFLTISIDERRGQGSGVELATGSSSVSGRYVHASYEGQVEDGLDLAQLPSGVAFFAMLAAGAGVWLPRRKGFWVGLAAGLVGLLGLFWIRQALSGPALLAEVAFRYGYWLAAVAILIVTGAAAAFLYRTSWTYLHR